MLTISGMHKGETKLTIPNQVVREQLFAYILDTCLLYTSDAADE